MMAPTTAHPALGSPGSGCTLYILLAVPPKNNASNHGAGHWVPYEAADRVNAALLDMLR